MANGRVIALGYFDGVHKGHGGLLSAARTMADEMGLTAAAVTFDPHPSALLTGKSELLLTHAADRETLMRRHYGIDEVLTLHFDETLMQMPWQDFANMLLHEYGAKGLVCGHDFRCGRRGEGNAEKLQEFCSENGMRFSKIEKITLNGETVSSTLIRKLVESGEMKTATEFLGHPHILTGTVMQGHHLGHTLGIPTANVAFPQGLIVPASGVYATEVCIGETCYMAVTNVGTHPTVNQRSTPWAEPWILDFDGDLYGKEIEIRFYTRLREERKFPSLDALKAEILHNAEETRTYFAK